MKTKNNVQKTMLRWAAVVVSFVLISFTVNAQDFWKRLIENSGFSDIALAMVETSNEAERNSEPAESREAINFEIEAEPEMEVEAWMTNYTKFDVGFQLEEEHEAELGVEDWMIDETVFQWGKENRGLAGQQTSMTSENPLKI